MLVLTDSIPFALPSETVKSGIELLLALFALLSANPDIATTGRGDGVGFGMSCRGDMLNSAGYIILLLADLFADGGDTFCGDLDELL